MNIFDEKQDPSMNYACGRNILTSTRGHGSEASQTQDTCSHPLLIFFVNVTTLFNSTSLIFREPSDQDQPGVHPLNQPIDPNKNQ